jgi:hypothetical protein
VNHRVEVCSPEEAARVIARFADMERMLHGHVDAICRNEDGTVAWEIHQKNVITDTGRRRLMADGWYNGYVFTSPSLEPAVLGRYSILDDGVATSSQISGLTSGVYDGVTYTKTWSPTAFAAPAAPHHGLHRRIACEDAVHVADA